MQVIELVAENYKKLRAVQVRPTGALVQISGKNGNGKSSLLDALWVVIRGAAVAPPEPIRQGAERAVIRANMGELTATRTFARKEDGGYTTELRVENAEGVRLAKPQDVLNALCDVLAFDPLEFARLKAADQVEVLKRFVPGVDFAQLASADQKDYEARTDYNRAAKQAKAAADAIQVPEGTPEEPVDDAALVAQLAGATEHNSAIEKRRLNREKLANSIAGMLRSAADDRQEATDKRAQAAQLLEDAQALEEQAAQVEANAATEQKRLDGAPPLPEPIDTKRLQGQITNARNANLFVTQRKQRDAHLRSASENQALADACTQRMADRKLAREQAIADAKLPVQGLSFNDGQVFLNGVPFEQASDAERLLASCRIAMAQNPKLRVLRIRDGSLLDEDSRAALAKLLAAEDFQCWMEVVDSSGQVGFVLEDGALKANGTNGHAVAETSPTATPSVETATAGPAVAARAAEAQRRRNPPRQIPVRQPHQRPVAPAAVVPASHPESLSEDDL